MVSAFFLLLDIEIQTTNGSSLETELENGPEVWSPEVVFGKPFFIQYNLSTEFTAIYESKSRYERST